MNSFRLVTLGALFLFVGNVSAVDALSFDVADENGDGFVSKIEIKVNPENEGKWTKADANKDGKLDSSEFSAFESMEETGASETDSGSEPTE